MKKDKKKYIWYFIAIKISTYFPMFNDLFIDGNIWFGKTCPNANSVVSYYKAIQSYTKLVHFRLNLE